MPLFDYECPSCKNKVERLVDSSEATTTCACGQKMDKLPPAASFKIKGLRAANGYGLKYVDSYGKSPVNGSETGCSFSSNGGGTIEHKFQAEGRIPR